MIAIFGKTTDEQSVQAARRLLDILAKSDVEAVVYKPFYQHISQLSGTKINICGAFCGYDDLPDTTRYLISLGGDGTFLNSINIVRDSGIPVVGINTGRLGFLANVSNTDLHDDIEKLLANKLPVEERTLMHTTINGKPAHNFPYAMNDTVIHKNAVGLITVHTWSNNDFLNSYWADGLIVSTPTGSTAYSLSVGGPIVAPQSQNFIISPIAAHNLNVRPLVIPDNVVLRLIAECREKDRHFSLSLDSRSVECCNGDEIEIKRAPFKVKTIQPASFFATLRNKLMWGADKRN